MARTIDLPALKARSAAAIAHAVARHQDAVESAEFSPDGLRVLTVSEDQTARVWDARTGKEFTEPLRHDDTVSSAQFSPNGLRVVTASRDKTVRVWDIPVIRSFSN